MKNSRFLCWCVGASLAVSLTPMLSFAQTTSGTSTGGTTIGGSAMGGSATGGAGNNQSSNTANPATAAAAVKSITSSSSGGTGGGGGTSTAIPSSSNVLMTTYVDPLSIGMASKWTQFGVPTKPNASFGKALYTNSTSTTRGGAGGAGGTANSQGSGFSTYGTPRSPSYSTVMDPDMLLPQMAAPQMQSNLRAALERSSYLSNQKNINIVVNGSTVELRGVVANEKERRAAENIVGTSPGVFDVINQLQVQSN